MLTSSVYTNHSSIPYGNRAIGLMSRGFANGPRDRGSILGWLKKKKKVPDVALLSIQHYKVRIMGKVEQSK